MGNTIEKKITVLDIAKMKKRGVRGFPYLRLMAFRSLSSWIGREFPVILVGDSVGMVEAGYDSTLPVTVDEIIYHTRAVKKGAKRALVVADMPFMSYQVSLEEAKV